MVDLGPDPLLSPVQEGDEVILFGKGGTDISVIAKHSGRKAYEISCAISQRVAKVYT